MRSRFVAALVAALVAAGLLHAPVARAEDPCAEDIKEHCGHVKVGAGRVQNCLRENEAKLSPACRSKRAATEARFRAIAEEFGAACKTDRARLCSEVESGQGRVIACLLRQQDDLSSSCRPLVERYRTAADTVAAVRTSCTADVEHLCPGIPRDAGPVVECLQENQASLSETCRTVDAEMAMKAAELVDAVAVLTSEERIQETTQILQGIESVAFSRSQVLLQIDSFQGLGGAANANRLLFNPQVVFGPRNQFAVQLKAPLIAVYPYAPERSAQSGLGAVSTVVAWAFARSTRVQNHLAFSLQWKAAVEPPVGAAWGIAPTYAISVGLWRGLSVTGQFAWVRTFASERYPDVNLLLVDPIIVIALPGRSFAALDTKLGWNLTDGSFLPVMKGIVGLYIDRKRSLSVSAWYQASLTDEAALQTFKFGVGTALAYFFDL